MDIDRGVCVAVTKKVHENSEVEYLTLEELGKVLEELAKENSTFWVENFLEFANIFIHSSFHSFIHSSFHSFIHH